MKNRFIRTHFTLNKAMYYYNITDTWYHYSCIMSRRRIESAIGLHNHIRIQNGAGDARSAIRPKKAMYSVGRNFKLLFQT